MEPLDSTRLKVGNPSVEPTQPKKSQSAPTVDGDDGVELGALVVVPVFVCDFVCEGLCDECPVLVEVANVLDPVVLAPVDAGPVEVGVVWVTGQIVVERTSVTVVRMVERAGQFVTVLWQLMIVDTRVV